MFERKQLQQLYQYGLSLTRNSHDAHDLLQNALEKWVRQGRETKPLAYIRRIMRNQFIDDCRQHQLIAFEPLPEDIPTMVSGASLEQQYIDSDMIEQLLQHLNTAEREVLFLWAVLGYSSSEIAQELQTSRGTILSRLFRVKKKIKDLAQSLETSSGLLKGAGVIH